jgi:hypothetical protein
LKDDFDITQSFITSRRNFNTKYYNNETEIISSDNNQINLFEEERDINIKNKKKVFFYIFFGISLFYSNRSFLGHKFQ